MKDFPNYFSIDDLDLMRSHIGEWWDPDNQCWMPSEMTNVEMQKLLFDKWYKKKYSYADLDSDHAKIAWVGWLGRSQWGSEDGEET